MRHGNIVTETIEAPMPKWKRMGFESRAAVMELYPELIYQFLIAHVFHISLPFGHLPLRGDPSYNSY